jgi:ABC-2 type transport system permease protein
VDRLIVLVLTRWKLELRGFARARERAVGLALALPGMLIVAGIFSLLAFFGTRAVQARNPELLLPLLSVLATGFGLLWALSPVLTGVAFTETHDLSRLLHFPIPLRTLVASSLLANLLQPMVLAEAPVLVALALGLSARAAAFPFALAGVVLSFAFILSASQVAGLALHAISRNRRYHDLALFLGLALSFVLSLLPLLLMAGAVRGLPGLVRFLTAGDLFALSPFAWGARAAVYAGRGEAAPFLGFSALAVGGIGATLALSAEMIHRIYRGELVLGGAQRGSMAPPRMVLPGRLGALVEKDLRCLWREPAMRAVFVMGLLSPLLFLFFLSQTSAMSGSGTWLLGLASFVGLAGFGANVFGIERRGIATLLGFPLPRHWILVGKNLASMALRLPGLLMLLLGGAFMASPLLLPAAATIAFATLLVAAGADNYMSILFPITIPAPGQSAYGGVSAGGRGLGSAVVTAFALGGVVLASAPFAFLAWLPVLLEEPRLWLVSLPLALAGAAATYAMLVAGAARLLRRREPELLERILGEA